MCECNLHNNKVNEALSTKLDARYDINNNRYKEKEDGSYWAGLSNNMSWRKPPVTETNHRHQYEWFKASTQEYVLNNRHPDGCFKCPRCKLHHYIPDNFELLCDTCVDIVLEHSNATPEQVEGIKLWQQKKKLYWSANRVEDKDIEERLLLRDKLINDVADLMYCG
jgi:hypothetical protein